MSILMTIVDATGHAVKRLAIAPRLYLIACLLGGFCLLGLTACKQPPKATLHSLQGLTQGTTYSVKFWSEIILLDDVALQAQINQRLQEIDWRFSNYREDSQIERFNQQKSLQPYVIDPEITDLAQIAKIVYKASERCYDPTIKPLFNLWGFTQNQFYHPNAKEITDTLLMLGFDKLEIGNGNLQKHATEVTLDFSAIGQGYSVGQIAQLLSQQGIDDYLVEIGGEMVVRGHKPDGSAWRVAIEKPLPNSNSINKVISNTSDAELAIMTSGTYRHFFSDSGKRYSHVLDPRTGAPVEHQTVAVTVLHADPTLADAWSTALLCLGSAKGVEIASAQNIAAIFFDEQQTTIKEITTPALQSGPWTIQP